MERDGESWREAERERKVKRGGVRWKERGGGEVDVEVGAERK